LDSSHTALCTALLQDLGWPTDIAVEMGQYAHVVSYEKHATIFHAGGSTDLLYVLLCGEVRSYFGTVDGARLLVSIIRSGQFFGNTDFHAPDAKQSREAQLFTAQARSRCKVAVIARARVVRRLQELRAVDLVRIIKSMDSKWVTLCGRLLTFMTQDVRRRLAQAIGEITQTFGVPHARGKLITLRLSHEDIAELIGASRPMVSKHLKALAQGRILAKESRRYVILQEDALASIASGKPAPLASQDHPSVPRGMTPTFTPMLERSTSRGRASARRDQDVISKAIPKRLAQRQLGAAAP